MKSNLRNNFRRQWYTLDMAAILWWSWAIAFVVIPTSIPRLGFKNTMEVSIENPTITVANATMLLRTLWIFPITRWERSLLLKNIELPTSPPFRRGRVEEGQYPLQQRGWVTKGTFNSKHDQDESDWAVIEPLPSYGRGRDTEGGRYISFTFGTNLTDVVITGDNGTIGGQGEPWWDKFHKGELQFTRPCLIEFLSSDDIQISNLTLVNSPSWNIHPTYSSNLIVQGVTILPPVTSPNTDGINPDSCTNVRIQDYYIVSGDDCIEVKSGCDEYGIAFGMPTKQLFIKRLTCISPFSATIAQGSEMSGGIEDVRAEDTVAINTESGVRIKTAVGRGGYVKDICVKGMTLKTIKYIFWMTGNSRPYNNYDPNALPVIEHINYRDVVAENVTMARRLEGIPGDPFTGICISNVTIELAQKAKKLPWNCTDISGISSGVTPQPCDLLPEQEEEYSPPCDFPTEHLLIDEVEVQSCSCKTKLLKKNV